MIQAIRAEFRKLFTIRSTYVILALAVGLEGLFALYVQGYKLPAESLYDHDLLANQMTSAINVIGVLVALVGLFLITHEYRYNTILYTLTSASNRTKVLAAKFIAVSVFSIIAALLFTLLAPAFTVVGVNLAGHTLTSQYIPLFDILWRTIFAGWSFSVLIFLIATIIRSQVGAIAFVFLFPGTVEPLLTLLLKHNAAYLPFTAINGVLQKSQISYTNAALTVLAYIAVGSVIAWVQFTRRDAN